MFRDTAGHEDLTEKIIECGIRVHEELGPGLYESIYKTCLLIELEQAGLGVEFGRRVPVNYRGRVLQAEFCPDLIVAGIVIVELKAVERLAPIHTSQVVTYLKITGLPVGLLMNFNVQLLRQGVRRVARPDLYVKR